MIIAHIQHGTLLTLMYPISIFSYALLEETRPKKHYWITIVIYTNLCLFFKYIFQLYPMRSAISEEFNNTLRSIRLGIYVKKSIGESFLSFYIWEILVLMFITIHILLEISIGLWDIRETDIENIEQTVSRLYSSQQND